MHADDRQPVLTMLERRIDERVRAIGEAHPWWPCRRGCDRCCRSLGEVPHATPVEWERLGRGLAALPEPTRGAVEQRVAALSLAPNVNPVACPFLDPDEGACLVYAHRLLACRTYGYYVSQGAGRWCDGIEAELARRDELVLLGNLDAVVGEARARGGEPITLLDWWRDAGELGGSSGRPGRG